MSHAKTWTTENILHFVWRENGRSHSFSDETEEISEDGDESTGLSTSDSERRIDMPSRLTDSTTTLSLVLSQAPESAHFLTEDSEGRGDDSDESEIRKLKGGITSNARSCS